MNAVVTRPILWAFSFLGVAAIRLALTGDRDILALNAPYDEYWYIQDALRLVWGGPYTHMVFAQLPVYSLWLALLHLFGIPARLAIDVAWLLAAGYLSFALYRFCGYRWVATVTFLFLAFHPYAFIIFDHSLAETLLAVLSTIVLAAGIELWNSRDKASNERGLAPWVYAVSFALAFHTRREGIVLLAPLILLACWSWKDRAAWWSLKGRSTLAIPLLVAPLAATLVLGILLAGANYLRWGVFARYELAAPGYQKAVAALNSIDVGRTPRHVTVTARARALAYEASPTFRELKSFFEGVQGRELAVHSVQDTGYEGEIGNGWFYWSLRDAGAVAGWHRDAVTGEAKYRAIAEELNRAFEAGALKKRPFAVTTFLDPDVRKWIGDVPQSVWNEFLLVGWPRAANLAAPVEDASPKQLSDFVEITGRRHVPPTPSVVGWIVAPVGTVVGLGTSQAALATRPVAESQRPDVPGAYPFKLSAPTGEVVTHLHARAPDGQQGSIALSDLREGQMAKLTGPLAATLGVDHLSAGPSVPRIERWVSRVAGARASATWLSSLCELYDRIGSVFSIAAVVSIAVAVIRRQAMSAAVLVIVLSLTAVMARAAALGILDASSWNGMQARYVFPVVPAFACAGMIGLALVYRSVRRAEST